MYIKLVSFVILCLSSIWPYCRLMADKHSNTNTISMSLSLNEKNGDLTVIFLAMRDNVELMYRYDPYAFYATFKSKVDNSIQTIDPPIAVVRFEKYVAEEIQQIIPEEITCNLKNGEKSTQTIKIWDLAIWEKLRTFRSDGVFTLSLMQRIVIQGRNQTVVARVQVDHKAYQKLVDMQKASPAKKQQIKWLFYPRVKNLVRHQTVVKHLAEKCLETTLDQAEIIKLRNTISDSNERLKLYNQFLEWDKQTAEEQAVMIMRPWRNTKGVPLDFFAKVIGLNKNLVTLEKETGEIIQMRIDEFSKDNQDYILKTSGVSGQRLGNATKTDAQTQKPE